MSAYYLAGYLSLAIPSVLAGLAATRFGLTHTYVAFGAAAAITCGAAGRLGSRLTPKRHRPYLHPSVRARVRCWACAVMVALVWGVA